MIVEAFIVFFIKKSQKHMEMCPKLHGQLLSHFNILALCCEIP